MKLYTFYNKNTGAYRDVKAFYFHEALNKCPSSRGWTIIAFVNV